MLDYSGGCLRCCWVILLLFVLLVGCSVVLGVDFDVVLFSCLLQFLGFVCYALRIVCFICLSGIVMFVFRVGVVAGVLGLLGNVEV